jgi:hypothetical protein
MKMPFTSDRGGDPLADAGVSPASVDDLRAEYQRMSIFLRDLTAQINQVQSDVHELRQEMRVQYSAQAELQGLDSRLNEIADILEVYRGG